MSELDDWVQISDAPARIGRSLSTIYRWLGDPNVNIRRMRPGSVLWLNLTDLLRVDAEAIRTRGRRAHEGA